MNVRILVISSGILVALGAWFATYVGAGSQGVYLGGQKYGVIIADDSILQEKGLSNKQHLARDQAMLFVFDEPGQRCFWMKDMRFSIDMVWLDADKRVVHIERNVSPKTYPKSFCPSVPAQYVVETNANATKGLKVGDHVSF